MNRFLTLSAALLLFSLTDTSAKQRQRPLPHVSAAAFSSPAAAARFHIIRQGRC